MSIRLMCAHDHVLLRVGVIQLFQDEADIEVVAESSSGAELFGKLRETAVDVLLLGMPMPAPLGADLIERIKSTHPDVRVLVLSMHDDILIVLRAMRAGASGHVTTYCAPKTLLGAVRKVATTGRYLDPEVAEKLAYAATSSGTSEIELLLSEREMQILPLIVEGKCIKAIANELSISDKTVSTHKAHILSKLGVHNVPDLVRYVMHSELSDLHP